MILNEHGENYPLALMKEVKDHGEGGTIIGKDPKVMCYNR